jgi:hypothetical protein
MASVHAVKGRGTRRAIAGARTGRTENRPSDGCANIPIHDNIAMRACAVDCLGNTVVRHLRHGIKLSLPRGPEPRFNAISSMSLSLLHDLTSPNL